MDVQLNQPSSAWYYILYKNSIKMDLKRLTLFFFLSSEVRLCFCFVFSVLKAVCVAFYFLYAFFDLFLFLCGGVGGGRGVT